jgi:hypothetical protein
VPLVLCAYVNSYEKKTGLGEGPACLQQAGSCIETFENLYKLSLRGAIATWQSYELSNGYGIASSAFGLLAMTNGAFFKGLIRALMRRFFLLLICVCFAGFAGLIPVPSRAEKQVVGDAELATIIGRLDIAFSIADSDILITSESFKITDSDGVNSLEFAGIKIDDGLGGGFSLDTPPGVPGRLDIVKDYTHPENDYLLFEVPDRSGNVAQPYISVDQVFFAGAEIGRLYLDKVVLYGTRFRLRLLPPLDGKFLDSDLGVGLGIGEMRYVYNKNNDNTDNEALSLKNIRLAQSAAGAPETPAAWTFSGLFRIGDIEGLFTDPPSPINPITVEIHITDSPDKPYMLLSLPIAGALRVENVNFGNRDFGPVAIDGIVAHTLKVRIPD